MRSWLSLAIASAFVVVPLAASCAKAGPCEVNSDCAVGHYCFAGTCKLNCVDTTRDCDPGYVCNVNGQCALGDGGVPEGGGPDGSTGPDGSVSDAPAGDTFVPDAAAGTLRELDLCAADAQCESGLLCRSLYVGGPTRCTPTCSSDGQCFSAGRCLKVGADTYCVMGDTGKICGAATDCNYGCLTSAGYCTVGCTGGADCPNGYGCATVSSQKVCVKAEEYCGPMGKTCASLSCDQSLLASGCTLGCSSASDCPQRASVLSPWTCSGSYCKRPGDVVGPLGQAVGAEYACDAMNNVVNLCDDAQHIDFTAFTIPAPPAVSCPASMSVAGSAGDVCVDTCRYAGGCSFGYACTGVGDIQNTRVGLCLPSLGGNEVGGACSHDADCAFGYCSKGACSRDCSGDGLCPTGSTCTAVGGTNPTIEGVPFKRCQ